MNRLPLGKRPATADHRDLLFRDYVKPRALPKPPSTFGHDDLIADNAWGMLGNDVAGDCVEVEAAHAHMLWKAEAKQTLTFSTNGVLSDYSANSGWPNSDDGTEVREYLGYRRSTGIIDARGRRHKILAYVALEPGNLTELWQALYLFGEVCVGVEIADSVWDQFDRGVKWTVVSGSPIDGLHCVPVIARRNGVRFVTWGRETVMSQPYYQVHNDEAWAVLSTDMIVNQHSPEGFDLSQLQADLKAL